MFCRQCGSEVPEGQKFCNSCGAVQVPGAAKGGMSTPVKAVIIGLVAVVVVVGTVLAIYFGTRNGSKTEKPPDGLTDNKSRGSEKLAYLDSGDIYTVDLDGTGRRKLTGKGDIVDFAVAPDGSRIAFVTESGEQSIIFKMRADGTDVSQVTLPEKGWADNPAFDPDAGYIYFTRVTPEGQADIEASRPHAVQFERYDIASNKVDRLSSYEGLQEQSIEGLYVDPAGGDVYFNLFGSDFPSSVPYVLELGPPVSKTVYMPMKTDDAGYTAVAFQLTGFSRDGADVAYYKQALLAGDESYETSGVTIYACFRPAAGGTETTVASYTPEAYEVGSVKGLEFSTVSDSTYYFAKVQSGGGSSTSTTLTFYKGSGSSSARRADLSVTVANDTERYTPLVWHLLHVK